MNFPDLLSALKSVPWRKRLEGDEQPQMVDCLLDWNPTEEQPEAPDDALVWYDVPVTFDPPSHQPRFVIRKQLRVGPEGEVTTAPPHRARRQRLPAQEQTTPTPSTNDGERSGLMTTITCASSASPPPLPSNTSPTGAQAGMKATTTSAPSAGSAMTP